LTLAAWDEIRDWRRAKRTELIERRRAISREMRLQAGAIVAGRIAEQIPGIGRAVIGFYWPIKGELDLREFVADCLTRGANAALPVVVAKDQPVEFHAWSPSCEMTTGFGNIPVPARGDVVIPTLLLVPLIGFDAQSYRLGYGSGYYDRTLAALAPRPLTVGVGYEWACLESIHPQPHDIAMDAIATDSGFTWRDDVRESASPACLMGEADPAYFGYLGRQELLDLLNLLLECERGKAGDESRFCAMLSSHIKGLLGTPSAATGHFSAKLIADMLRAALPKITQAGLHRDLSEMLAVHENNTGRERQTAPSADGDA
jgi:5-formyltetrahydrofolate cyclo-ligase